jgi:hypothetical protein
MRSPPLLTSGPVPRPMRHAEVIRMQNLIVFAIAVGLMTVSCTREQPAAPQKTASPQGTPTAGSVTDELAVGCTEDQFKVNGIRLDPQLGKVLFAHPQSKCTLQVPQDHNFVTFSFGMFDTATIANPPTDGVEFRVLGLDTSGQLVPIWQRSLRPTGVPDDRGPQAALVRLNGFKKVIFETTPLANTTTDWAYWRNIGFERDVDALKLLADNKTVDQFHSGGLRTIAGLGEVLFAQPKSEFVFPLLQKITGIHFRFGLLDEATKRNPPTDGVEFRVSMQGVKGRTRLWSRILRPTTVASDRGVKEITITPKIADESRLVFETLPAGGLDNDLAYWTAVEVTASK